MTDNVNHPAHYAEGWSNGAEVIDITEHLNFNRGNAVKYITRAGKKNPDTELEDLRKAVWYLNRELSRLGHTEAAKVILETPYTDADIKLLNDHAAKRPRIFERINDVPGGIVVQDHEGNFWHRDACGNRYYRFSVDSEDFDGHHWHTADATAESDDAEVAPYKEVL